MWDFPRSQQIWWLVDCDSFYASCEAYLNPAIRDLPICVGKDVTIACNQIAKSYGVRVGTPFWTAKEKLPEGAVFLTPKMGEYGRISQMLMDYLRSKCLSVEEFSIDEAFFEISGYGELYTLTYPKIAKMLQQDIRKKIGISVSIWLWPTRLLAKIFADINKPYGTYIALNDENIDTTLGGLPLADIPFIGTKTQAKLEHRCTSALDFKQLPYSYVKQLLGVSWLRIWFELNSINANSFEHKEYPQGISRTRSINPYFTNDKEQVRAHLMNNIDKALEHLHDVGMEAKSIRLSFRDQWFKRFGVEDVFVSPTHRYDHIILKARAMFEKLQFGSYKYRTTGIHLYDLTRIGDYQQDLFSVSSHSEDLLTLSIHNINKKYWLGTVRMGCLPSKHKSIDSLISLVIQ